MQNKNLILFVVLAALILGGWFYLQQVLPPPAKKEDAIARNDKKEDKKEDKKPEPPVKKEKDKEKDDKEKKPAPAVQHAAASPDVTIGGDEDSDYYVQTVLTSKGAGVRKLVLTRFKAANWLGQPEDRNLQLIQDDAIQPSFRLYHFPGGDAEAKPVFGMGEQQWTLVGTKQDAKGIVNEVAYATQVPGMPDLEITKTYRVEPKTYHLELTLQMHDTRKAGGALPFRYQLTGGHGLPIEGEWYTSICFRNAVIAQVEGRSVFRNLQTADRISLRAGGDRVPSADRGDTYVQYAGVMNQYFASLIVPDDTADNYKNQIAWGRPTNESSEVKGIVQKIDAGKNELEFLEIGTTKDLKTHTYRLLPRVKEQIATLELQTGAKAVVSWYETPDGARVATWIRAGHAVRSQFDDIAVRVNSEQLQLKPGQKVAHRYLLYHGPVKTSLLGYLSGDKAVDPELVERYTHTLHLNTLTDYASPGYIGDISQTIRLTDVIIAVTKAMHWLLWIISSIVPRPLSGLTIILLTVIVRGLMFPISRRQALFSVKMQELAPELKKVQEKYKSDPQAKTQAVMELYRKHKIHPLGSCLPLFMQMPIFMGLYFALQESIQFRLAPFIWIDNLAAPDMLLWWGQWIPLINDPDNMGGVLYLGPFLNILPIVAVVFMVIQQKLMTPPATDEQQEQQQKMMRWMSIVFGVMFYKVAAGLCIYFISSSLWGLAERKLLPRKKAAATDGPAPNGVLNGPPPPRAPRRGGRNQPKKPPEGPPGAFQKIKGWWSEVLKQAEKK